MAPVRTPCLRFLGSVSPCGERAARAGARAARCERRSPVHRRSRWHCGRRRNDGQLQRQRAESGVRIASASRVALGQRVDVLLLLRRRTTRSAPLRSASRNVRRWRSSTRGHCCDRCAANRGRRRFRRLRAFRRHARADSDDLTFCMLFRHGAGMAGGACGTAYRRQVGHPFGDACHASRRSQFDTQHHLLYVAAPPRC